MRPGQDGEPAEGTGESADPAGDTGSSSYAPGGQGEATENSRTDAEGKTGTADGAFAVGSAAGPAATAERPKPPGSADTAATVVRAKPERPEGTRVALSPSGSVWPDVPAAPSPAPAGAAGAAKSPSGSSLPASSPVAGGTARRDDASAAGASASVFEPRSASRSAEASQITRRADPLTAPNSALTKRSDRASGSAPASARGPPRHDPLTGPRPSFTKKADLPDSATGPVWRGDPPGGSASGSPVTTAAASADPAPPAWRAAAAPPPRPTAATWPAGQVSPLGSAPVARSAGSRDEAAAAGQAPGTGGSAAETAGNSGSQGAAAAGGSAAGGSGGWGSGPGGPGGPPSPWSAAPSRSRRLGPVLGSIAAAVAMLVAGGAYLYVQKSSPAEAAGNGQPHKKAGPAAKTPEHLLSMTPADGTTGVNGAARITVIFSEPLSATSPMPTISPAIDGTWQRHGNTAVFVPARGFGARTKVTVQIPAGAGGMESARGGVLATPVTAKFRTGSYSPVRIEQLLAQLGYLPLDWAPQTGTEVPLSDANAQLRAAYSPPAGTYTWQSGYPSALMRLWSPDKPSEILRGAVMAFQADHGLTSDMIYENQEGLTLNGSIGRRLWRALFRAITRDQANKHGYTYALASQRAPETLTVWHNGVQIFRNPANSGVPVAPTAVGTDPVYIRYQSQIMKGTNPDGTKYADPVAWVAYFHAGEAVHYFGRYSYGSQQSLGCVELPWGPAKRIWPYLTFGTLVTVTAP